LLLLAVVETAATGARAPKCNCIEPLCANYYY